MEQKPVLTPAQLDYWGSEANFLNHTHCDGELDIVYPHDYVKTMTMLFNESRAQVQELNVDKMNLESERDIWFDELKTTKAQVQKQKEVIEKLTGYMKELCNRYPNSPWITDTAKSLIESALLTAKEL